MTKITYLNVCGNKINKIPNKISNLLKLKEFHIGHNSIKELPREIFTLGKLKCIDISKNMISKIPTEIFNLNLSSIALNGNNYYDTDQYFTLEHRLELLKIKGYII